MDPLATPPAMSGPVTTASSALSGRLKVDVGGASKKKKKQALLRDVVRNYKKKQGYAYD
jgi:hypothetical protein